MSRSVARPTVEDRSVRQYPRNSPLLPGRAMMASDGAAFDALCAAQMSYGHSGGKIQTKEEFIADATSGKAKWKALEFDNARNTVAGPNTISRFTLSRDSLNWIGNR